MQDCPTFSLDDRYLLIYKVYVQRLLDAVWKYKDKALMFPACDIYSVSCFVITDTNHYTFSSFCSSTAASLVDIEWTPQHPHTIAAPSKRAVLRRSSFIAAPPWNQSIKFNIHTPALDQSECAGGGLETVVREGSSQSASRAAWTKAARQRALVAWTEHYSCPRWAHLRRHDEPT